MTRLPRSALLAVATVLASACATSGLSFVQDTRVQIIEPEQSATVSLPFELLWTVEDFDGTFLVLFDRSPMRPDEDLRSLVPEDSPCLSQPDCPDATWLADRFIYVTTDTRLTVDRLPELRDSDRASDRHYVTIALLDGDGRRAGESAWVSDFIVERER